MIEAGEESSPDQSRVVLLHLLAIGIGGVAQETLARGLWAGVSKYHLGPERRSTALLVRPLGEREGPVGLGSRIGPWKAAWRALWGSATLSFRVHCRDPRLQAFGTVG